MCIVLRVMRLTYTRGVIRLSNCVGLSRLTAYYTSYRNCEYVSDSEDFALTNSLHAR